MTERKPVKFCRCRECNPNCALPVDGDGEICASCLQDAHYDVHAKRNIRRFG